MDHFDRSVKYLIDKGFTLPDTDESDSGNEEENEEMEMELADYRQKPLNEIRDESPSPVPPQVQSPCSDFKDENAEPLELSLVLNADQGPQEEVIVMPSDGNGYIDEQRSTNREISKKSAIRSKDTGRRKQVKFNKKVDVQSPETSERMRLEAARIISVQKFEREQKLVSLVYRESGKVKIQSEQNYNHPNFPFPPDYKRIDFDHIDPYKLFQAAEYLRQEQERFQEPFKLHAKKMWMLGKKADEVCANEERFLESLPSNPLPKVKPKTLPFFPAPPYSHVYKKEIRRHRKLDPNISTSGISLFAKMEGKKPKGFPGYYPKPTDLPPQFQPHPRPHSLAMRNVALWLKSNFLMKPVPLLHSSAFPDSDPAPRPSVMSNISPPLTIYPDPLPDPSAIKEIYIINGLIQPPNIFTTTVGNSFDEEYDKSPFKDIWNTAPWTPHCFRYVPHIHDFEDNEISLFFHRPFIMIVGESPRTQTRSGRRVEETIEIPDSVQLKNLRFYRLRDGKIVIEESARRKVSTLPW